MITIRKALPADADFIASHAYRLLNFDLPRWRANERDNMIQADVHHITKALLRDDPEDCVFIATDEENSACGFMRVLLQKDYYTGEKHAHVNDIVVTSESEGKGVGKLLLQKADKWAIDKKARWITLNVFETNSRARTVYEKQGYHIEWLKYLKQL